MLVLRAQSPAKPVWWIVARFKNTSGIPQERLVIETQLVLGPHTWKVEVSLANRANMNLPLILGRTAIRRRNILVHPGRSHLADGTRKDHK
jgi:hypothetical protein